MKISKNIIVVLLFIQMLGNLLHAQNDMSIRINETNLNAALDAVVEARGINYGEYGPDIMFTEAWYINVDDAEIDILSNNEVALWIDITLNAELDFELVTPASVTHGAGIVICDILFEGNYNDGYSILLDPKSLYLTSWDGDNFVMDFLGALVYAQTPLIVWAMPNIELNLGSKLLPDLVVNMFESTTPTISTTANEVLLTYTVNGPRKIGAKNSLDGHEAAGYVSYYDNDLSSWSIPYPSPNSFWLEKNTYNDIRTNDEHLLFDSQDWRLDRWDQTIYTSNVINIFADGDYDYTALFRQSKAITVQNSFEGFGNSGEVVFRGTNKSSPYNDFGFSPPYVTTIGALNQHIVGNDEYNFVDWENGSAQLSRNVSPTVPTTYTASYKGKNLTGNSNTYSNNNQRNIAQTKDPSNNNFVHKVYESMGSVWYEVSTNKGATWTIMNGGQPLQDNAKFPCLVTFNNLILVIYYVDYQVGYNSIEFALFSTTGTLIRQGTIYSYVEVENKPSVAWDNTGNVIVVFKDNSYGLNFIYGSVTLSPSPWVTWDVNLRDIPNTDNNSINPAVIGERGTSVTIWDYHLVWEQNASIKYQRIFWDYGMNDFNYSGYYDVSASLGYGANIRPSIADYVDDRFIVGWIAEAPGDIHVAAARPNFGTYWGTTTYVYSRGGHNVESINANNYPNGGVIIAYGSPTVYGQYVKTSNMTRKYNQTYNGDVKVSNGSNYSDMLLSTLVTSSTPYQFMHYGQGGLPKEGNNNNSITREINIASGDNRIFIDLGNIEVDGENIGFYNVDSLGSKAVHENNKLSNYLVSEGFDLTDKSEIYFDFGIEKLNENEFSIGDENGADVKVLLLDDKTNELISEVKSTSVKSRLTDKNKKAKFKLNSDSKEKRRIKLALIINGVKEDDMNLVTIVGDSNNDLPKEGIEEIFVETLGVVKEYNILQNYPNPFNPSTTIKYELPGEGFVTIKVFDVLGKEVATLVNKKQDSGSYEVTFNGESGSSRIASGMYVYKIDVKSGDPNYKDFSSVRKMLLIK
jgi:hypothetical protein